MKIKNGRPQVVRGFSSAIRGDSTAPVTFSNGEGGERYCDKPAPVDARHVATRTGANLAYQISSLRTRATAVK